MNLYIKKISTLAGVGVISILSTFQSFKNVDAALTPPTDYDIGFESISSAFYYTSSNGTSPTSIALFTRSANGVYFDYTHNFSSGQHSNTTGYDLPVGLDITMTFNRSNTSWTDSSGAGFTGYYASDTKIGSDGNVGSTSDKMYFQFDNQTNKDYLLYFDILSTSGPVADFIFEYNSNQIQTYFSNIRLTNSNMKIIYLPSYTNLTLYTVPVVGERYFDAWYLQDLGISASYQEGYDLGETEGYADGLGNNPNVLLNGFSAMVGILVNFMLLILNLEAFGISILSVFGVLAFFVGVIWFFKLLRG
jgi:hypothetical protein